MFARAVKEYSKEEVLEVLHPAVAEWFDSNFPSLSPPQRLAIVPISEGKNVLISSPTGTGKTLTAFLSIISEIIRMGETGELDDSVYAIYVSPLRALNNDIYRNLEVPLREIRERNPGIPEIRHSVRTGDTTPSEKSKQLRKPPHILITTPETLSIILTAPKFREKLKSVRWVIVDEIHSLVENKRGSHLSLSLERLRYLTGRDFVRIGLSATINPLEEVARFLVGYENGRPRDCVIVETSWAKALDLALLSPVDDLVNTPSDLVSSKMYELISELVRMHRTTLIFTNTRSGTERVVFHLKKIMEPIEIDEAIAAHHSSLSRQVRGDVEERLKRGELRAIVSSTSLELGIDIGYIDLVVQIGSPKSVTRALQRVGRAGHKLHEVSKGRFIVVDRDDAVEVAVMLREAMRGRLDKVHIPMKPLDVLAQHIVGMAVERKWDVREAFDLVRSAYPFRDLSWEEFESVLKYLAGDYVQLESRKVYGKIWYDASEGKFGRRGKYIRVIYAANVGTIPDEVDAKVYTTDGKLVGSLEEEFLERLLPGDRFVLGGRVYEFVSARGLKVKVRPAYDQKPTVPSWFSEMLPLSYELAIEIGKFRELSFRMLDRGEDEELVRMIMEMSNANENAARAIYTYLKQQYLYLKSLGLRVEEMPSNRVIMIESYIDDAGRTHQVTHSLFGRRVNDALSRALAYLAGSRLRRNLGISVMDTGFSVIYPRGVEPVARIDELTEYDLRELLKRAVEKTELLRRRFRHVAARGLMILRNYKGYDISVNKQQISAQNLLKVVSEIDEFPLLKEAYREIMEDYMDIRGAQEVLEGIKSGEIRVLDVGKLDVPTPFAHGIILEGLSDLIFMEDKMSALRRFQREIEKILRE
ncbi:ATP-dependent helicase [Candidatus Korarchaeum cryptofilum]|uniref:ATP-dependent helicase n=1 Tax=Candidatus Korarchaeum cryptofilum TaxID=498846 RepID=A0A429G6P0_9CREN|nr:ATP-dependent helicase [Candidatus Korarchaeum cryptofilum]RSN69485.1 ATP-dependent helicase [Candidatus Korarchaeum cryptofilum]